MRINEIILISDLDGTIVPITGDISQTNINAINKFRELGGTFTVATGRSPAAAENFLRILGVDTPIIANNGALIYDIGSNKSLWCKYIDNCYKNIVKYVKKHYPQVGIEIITDDGKYYIASENDMIRALVKWADLDYCYVDESNYPDNCCKVLFLAPPEDYKHFVEQINMQKHENVEFVQSGGGCFEMMAQGISKGYPFERLVEIYGKELNCSAAIGDFYNDIEMLKKAGIGAAVGNAVDDAKKAANIIVKNCEDDGLADFIEYLIENSDK